MGMFDTINLICPHCGSPTGIQTKSGICQLNVWWLDDAPLNAVRGIQGQSECKGCGQKFHVGLQTVAHAMVGGETYKTNTAGDRVGYSRVYQTLTKIDINQKAPEDDDDYPE